MARHEGTGHQSPAPPEVHADTPDTSEIAALRTLTPYAAHQATLIQAHRAERTAYYAEHQASSNLRAEWLPRWAHPFKSRSANIAYDNWLEARAQLHAVQPKRGEFAPLMTPSHGDSWKRGVDGTLREDDPLPPMDAPGEALSHALHMRLMRMANAAQLGATANPAHNSASYTVGRWYTAFSEEWSQYDGMRGEPGAVPPTQWPGQPVEGPDGSAPSLEDLEHWSDTWGAVAGAVLEGHVQTMRRFVMEDGSVPMLPPGVQDPLDVNGPYQATAFNAAAQAASVRGAYEQALAALQPAVS